MVNSKRTIRIVLAGFKAAMLRQLWIELGVLALFAFMVVINSKRDSLWDQINFLGRYFGLMLLVAFGIAVATVPADMARKPISFCLPGHLQSVRMLVFISSLFYGIAGFWIMLVWPHHGSSIMRTSMYGTAAFLGGTVFMLTATTDQIAPWILLPALEFVFSLRFALAALIVVGVSAAYPPIIAPGITLISAILIVLFWRCLGDIDSLRDDHRRIIDDAARKKKPDRLLTTARPVEEFFLSQTRISRALGVWRYVWGCLYCVFDWVWLPKKRWLVLLLVIAVLLGYAGEWFVQFTSMALSGVVLAAPLPVWVNMLLPVGRRERFYGAVAVGVAVTLLPVAAVGAVAVLSWSLALLLPDINLDPGILSYKAIHPMTIGLPCVLAPWLLILQVFSRSRFSILLLIASIGNVVLVLLSGELIRPGTLANIFDALADPAIFVAMLLVGWTLFLLVLHDVCMNWSLVRPGGRARLSGGGR